MSTNPFIRKASITALLLGLAGAAAAHEGHGVLGGWMSGFSHPLLGWDHVVAMVAVGVWAAMLGRPAVWVLPTVFPLVMAAGAALAMAGLRMPVAEAGIALSAAAFGALIAFAVRAPVLIAGIVVGAFAVFHGYAHGRELPASADPVSYAFGFMAATIALHAAGLGLGLALRSRVGRLAVRAVGALVAAGGTALLLRLT